MRYCWLKTIFDVAVIISSQIINLIKQCQWNFIFRWVTMILEASELPVTLQCEISFDPSEKPIRIAPISPVWNHPSKRYVRVKPINSSELLWSSVNFLFKFFITYPKAPDMIIYIKFERANRRHNTLFHRPYRKPLLIGRGTTSCWIIV